MKTINETFEDEEYKLMKQIKNGLSWHDFIMLLITHAQESIKKGQLKIELKSSIIGSKERK